MNILSKTLINIGFVSGLVLTGSNLFAQKSNDIEVRDLNDKILKFPWTGGLNAPQFSEIDLNDDGKMDLFIFDREGDQVLTFLNNGTSGQVDYTYAPEYEASFPSMRNWALLVDYNNDGKADIFTYNNGGTAVYKNTSSGGILSFTLKVFPYLVTNDGSGPPFGNIYTSSTDIPAIIDVDSDGDIDILNFGFNSDAVTFYENFAADSGDIENFNFHNNTYCWGNIKEEKLSNKVILNATCPKFRAFEKANKHGGSTMLAFDPNGDDIIDVLIGDPGYTTLVFLENGGSKTYANIISQDTSFPSYNTSINLLSFPAAYNLDVNNDGLKDLIVAPNATNAIENYKGILYYKNIGTASKAIYSYQSDNFLQNEMIELGSYAYPTLFDHNFDGLMDLVVGNGGYFNGKSQPRNSLALFENTGTSTNPVFKLIDDDYAGVSQYNLNTNVNKPTLQVVPAFGDLNSDGLKDLIIGDFQGRLHYFQNEPKSGISDFVFNNVNYESIDNGSFSNPVLFDFNEDGLLDIVSGKLNGRVNLYLNIGTSIWPEFDSIPDTSKLGGVYTTPWNDYDGYSQANFYRASNDLFFLSGGRGGTIYRYNNVKNNLSSPFNLLDSLYLKIDVGNRSHVAIGDINNDGKMELIVGNSRGGLNLYYTDELVGIKQSSHNNQEDTKVFLISENQVMIRSRSGSKGNYTLFGLNGQELKKGPFNQEEILHMDQFSNGLYLIQTNVDGKVQSHKIILAR